MGKSQKNYMSIKSKLMAAVAMLLVASFMVVSSTYAWFTLSTAPEVTGITTKVGANGSLEIALVGTKANYDNPTGILSNVGDSTKADTIKNLTWGNIVNLSSEDYGLDQVTLLPAIMNLAPAAGGEGYAVSTSGILATPNYGADGRISSLEAKTLAAAYDTEKQGFVEGGYGVRAIGNMSAMTQQQLVWRQAVADVKSNLNGANSLASNSLYANGAGLANIILTKADKGDAGTYDITPIGNMLNSLNGTENVSGVLDYLKGAMEAYLIAGAAVVGFDLTDEVFNTVVSTIKTDFKNGVPDLSGDTYSVAALGTTVTIPDTLKKVYAEYNSISEILEKATGNYDGTADGAPSIADHTKADWSAVNAVLVTSGFIDIDNITVCGHKAEELKAKDEAGNYKYAGDLLNAFINGGLDVVLGKDSGAYYDIAQVTGDVRTAIKINGTVIGVTLNDAPATLTTKVDEADKCDLKTILPSVGPEDRPDTAGADKKLSEYYGYVVDLAFRTNATGSHLMLQTDAVNRIYSDSTDEALMGHGSTMSFGYSATFDAPAVIELMKSIRMVITDNQGNVLAYALLDTSAAKTSTDEAQNPIVTAPIKLCADTDVQIIELDLDGDVATADDKINVPKFSVEPTFKPINTKGQTEIMELQRNTATVISVYVYLDGETVDNGDVATGELSMTGSLNLQFSSDADLTPMSYAPLQGTTTETEQTAAPTNP